MRAGDYNQRTVLQSIRRGGETTRVELARTTGLTAPTIANITGRLIELGFVRLAGRRQGSRGQPALRLEIEPNGCYGIGVNVDRDHITMVAIDLAGEVRSRIQHEIPFATPEVAQRCVAEGLEEIIRTGGVNRDRILGAGIALPDDLGRIALPNRPTDYGAWSDVSVAALFGAVMPWPIHVDNDAAAAALGEAQSGTGFDNPSFFYLLVSAGLGGGLVIDRSYYRGATLRSGEIGLMPDPTSVIPGATVQDTVSLSALIARIEACGCRYEGIDSLVSGDPRITGIIEGWMGEAVRALAAPLIGINCLVNPDAVLIGGRLPSKIIQRLADRLNESLSRVPLPSRAPVLPATMARDAPAIGAAILPFLDHVLPSDAILIQAGR